MLADAMLPDEIVPVRDPWHRRAPRGRAHGCARRVLLTGATGFLGRWLAKELLMESQTRSSAWCGRDRWTHRRVCTPRSRDAGVASPARTPRRERWRVRVVDGDLSQPWLGIGHSQFEALAEDVDAICHAGAAVNWAQPYQG